CRLRFFLSDSRPLCWLALSADCCRELAPCACGLSMPSGGFEMAIPFVYNFRSVTARWTSSIVAVLGIAGTVGVFVAMLSGIKLEDIKILQDAPGVARASDAPLVTSEVVVVAPFPLRATGTDANA